MYVFTCVCVHLGMHVEARGQSAGVRSFLSLWVFWGSDSKSSCLTGGSLLPDSYHWP